MKNVIISALCLLSCAFVMAQADKGDKKFEAGQYQQALYWYEKCIDNNPSADSGYYGASQVFFLSTETVWALMYGELFMILSDNDSLQMKVSRQLFDAYFAGLSLNGGKAAANYNSNIIAYSDSFERRNNFPSVFDSLMSKSAYGLRFLDIENLTSVRSKFLSLLKANNKDFYNPLFEYWDKVKTADHWQAYNYWLFAYGNNKQAAQWITANKDKWNGFMNWKKQNPAQFTPMHYFSRYNME